MNDIFTSLLKGGIALQPNAKNHKLADDIFTSFLKSGIAVLFGVISGGGTETAIRAGVASFLKDFTASLPREVRESFISQATLAILEAPSQAHVELQITAVLAEIAKFIKENVKS